MSTRQTEMEMLESAERMRATSLRGSEALFAGIISLASDAIICMDEAQRIVLFNTGAEAMFGYRADEVLGQPLDILLPEGAREAHRHAVARFGAGPIAARRMAERGQVAGRRKDGTVFPAEASISKIDVDGRRIYTTVFRDVTERNRAEEELRLLQRITMDIINAADLHDALAVTLERVCRVIGWVYGEAWIPGRSGQLELAPVHYGADPRLGRFHQASRELRFAPGVGVPGTAWSTRKPLWIRDVATEPLASRASLAGEVGLKTALAMPALADDGVVAVLVLAHYQSRAEDARLVDLVSAVAFQLGVVIRAKQATQALRKHAADLQRSNAELAEFASVASHDLQEPLRKILSFGERLLSAHGDALPENARDYLHRMRDASLRMQALIEDLLTLSRVTTDARPFVPVSLDSVLQEVLEDLEVQIEEARAEIDIGELPVVTADPVQMRQLFQNLLSNAIKFRDEGQPARVRVYSEIEEVRGAPARCRIHVQDQGIGFDERYLDRIFGVFQRLHGRGRYPGTGMGLAICRKIVERHDGTITARSAPGAGATFTITLPLVREHDQEVQA